MVNQGAKCDVSLYHPFPPVHSGLGDKEGSRASLGSWFQSKWSGIPYMRLKGGRPESLYLTLRSCRLCLTPSHLPLSCIPATHVKNCARSPGYCQRVFCFAPVARSFLAFAWKSCASATGRQRRLPDRTSHRKCWCPHDQTSSAGIPVKKGPVGR